MKDKRTQPEMLPTLEVGDDFRHPMWIRPSDSELLHVHIRALRTQIATALTPLDGRPAVEFAVVFCQEVYEVTRPPSDPTVAAQTAGNWLWVLGKIAWLRYRYVRRLSQMVAEGQPGNQPIYRSNLGVVERMADGFTEAVCKSVDT